MHVSEDFHRIFKVICWIYDMQYLAPFDESDITLLSVNLVSSKDTVGEIALSL